jgi:prepilin-type processing-associated H-X9-DG protein
MAMWNTGAATPADTCITNGTLFSYVTDKRVYLCPTFAIELRKVDSTYIPARSYVMNKELNDKNLFTLKKGSTTLLFTELNTAKKVEGLSVTANAVVDTTVAALPTDSATLKYYTPKSVDGMIYCADGTIPGNETIAAYHNGKGQAVFADGHIEALYYSNTWAACQGNW